MNQGVSHSFDTGDGKIINIETGRLARQADGAVVVKVNNTMLLATIVSDKDASGDVDFLPLTVEYREKFAASGKFPGGFLKRENRPSDHEILIARLIDRAMRPLFPSDYHSNTVITVNLVSSDNDINPDCYAGLAAAAAIAVSDIPFEGPVSEVRVGRINGQLVINPGIIDLKNSDIDMIIAGNSSDVIMVEGEMKEISEKEMAEAIQFAHNAIKLQCAAINALAAQVPKSQTKRTYCHENNNEDLYNQIKAFSYDKCKSIASEGIADKHLRSEKFSAVKSDFIATLDEETASSNAFLISQYFHKVHKAAVRDVILNNRLRLDGRKLDEIRPIWTQIDYLPAAHGSSLFTRGETQSLTSVTLGSKNDVQMIDGAVFSGDSKFLLHYNFPPFSTGEARPPRATSRREVGHGNLALRALKGMVPEDCAYTIRVVSDILESNGSSSMATVCAGSMALMDAGIQMKKAVSGIAMGLITDDSGKYAVLSDILGDEDHLGDMDFKVCGTKDGITACQMDMKINGLSYDVLVEALEQAKRGREHIMGEMNKTITAPNNELKPHTPRIVEIRIAKEFIGAVIGPGGKIIQDLQEKTQTTIAIEEVDKEGVVQIMGPNKEAIEAALARIKGIVAVPEIGEVYDSTVKGIQAYGAFVEFLPGKQGLIHISEISHKRLESLDGVLKEGDHIKVKLLEIDKQGRYKLSAKVLIPKEQVQG